MDQLVVMIAGQSVTVGMISSFVTDLLKRLSWFPSNRWAIRSVVALFCVLANVGVAYASGNVPDLTTLLESFLAYLTAVTTHDHQN